MPSRTRSNREVRPTALVYCEGAHDLAFVRHIKKLYANKSVSNTRFTTNQGGGGSPDSLMQELAKIPGDFDRFLVKMDNDRTRAEFDAAVVVADRNTKIAICWSKPCLDALLLSILNPDKDYSRYQSKTCKGEFERDHIPGDRRTNPAIYDRVFTLEKLESARRRIPELNQLILFFET
jgi:hypothetical protein